MKKLFTFFTVSFLILFSLSSATFNNKINVEEQKVLSDGLVLIRNIDYFRNICLDMKDDPQAENIKAEFKKLQPKYLAEVIQYKPYEGNEDLPERLKEMLYNVGNYAGIPYYSEQKDRWYKLYDSAEITTEIHIGNSTELYCDFIMAPFGKVEEFITLNQDENSLTYVATNQNKLRYLDKFDCVYPKKMKIAIYLFRDGENWVLYGIGGVNAPKIPFFTERIETSFINRIKTFCNFIFKQF